MAGYIVSKADPFWTFSGGLAGVIGTSAGNDLYHPIQALIIAVVIVVIIYKLHYWVERRFKIDDAVGAVAVHGYTGFLGVVVAGFVLWGYPSSPDALLGHADGRTRRSRRGASSSAPSSCSSCSASSPATSCPGS